MAHDVFISYSSKDKNVADATCAVLEARGIRCWMAPRDILPGSEWGAAIVGAIGSARVMVLIYTSSSNASPQVRREVERAVARGLHVIPFRVEDVPMSPALEYFISSPHWLDALSPPLERHLDHLAKIIRAVLDAQKGPGESTPAAPALLSGGPPATGWTHGPPPGSFSPAPDQPAAQPQARSSSGEVAVQVGWFGLSFRWKVMVAASAMVVAIVMSVVLLSNRGEPGRVAIDPDLGKIQAPALPSPATAPVNSINTDNPPPTRVDNPVPPSPSPPAPDPRQTQAGEQDVKRFWDLLAQGNPRIPRLQELLDDSPKLVDQKNPAGNTPLYEAAKAGQARVVALLLNSGADRKAVSAGNNTALHGLAASGMTDQEIIHPLSAKNLDIRNADGDTPLHVAVKAGHADTARLLAEAGADVNFADKNGRTPLQLALLLDDPARAHATALALVNAGAKTDVADRRGTTPLHFAASTGDAALLSAMIQKGAKVDRVGPAGRTPLHVAVAAGKLDAVKLLLGKRAAIDVADDQGNTPLHLAATLPETTIAEILLSAGAKVTTATRERQTPLHVAAAAGSTAMVELFMRSGGSEVLTRGTPPSPIEIADKAGKKDVAVQLRRLEFPAMLASAVKSAGPVPPRLLEMLRKEPKLAGPQGEDGRNALHLCAASGNAAFAQELVKIDPSLVRAFSRAEETPLHVAAMNKQLAVAKVLLAAGASVRATTKAGDTPLHLAAKAGSREMAKVLLDAGADPAIENKARRLPVDLAPDPATRALLESAEQEAGPIREAWANFELQGRGFDVAAPGLKQPIRIRFKDRRNFSVEGDYNGTFKSFDGTYAKGALTLTLESPGNVLFPGITGPTYAGKVSFGPEDNRFTWKVGNAEIQFERP